MTRLKELNSNFESLTIKDMSKYAGQWIGIVKGKIVTHHDSLKEVQRDIKDKFPEGKSLIGKISENR